MKKFNIHHLPITANKEKINVLYLELKSEKNILYTIDNDNVEHIDLNLFKKMEFSENIQILPKKKSNELNLTIDHSNNLYSILINKKPLYTLKNNNSIILNNNICKLILSNGVLYSNKINNLVIESKKDNSIKKYDNDDNDYNNDIVNSILKKDVKSLPSSSTEQISSKKELTIFIEKKEEPESSNILDKNVSNTEDDHNDLLELEGSAFNDSKIIIENKIDNSTDVIIKKHYNIIKIDEDKSLELGNTNAQMIHTISLDDSSIDSDKFIQELPNNKEDSQKNILLESNSIEESIIEDSVIPDIKLENLSEEKSNISTDSIKLEEIQEISEKPACEIIQENIVTLSNEKYDTLSDIKSNISKDSIKLEVKEDTIQDKIIEVKKDQIDNEIFNLENILKDFNKLFKFMENKDNTSSDNLSLQETDKIKSNVVSYNSNIVSQIPGEVVLEKKIIQNNLNELNELNKTNEKIIPTSRIIKVYYQNIMYKINVYKLEHTNDLNYANLFKTKISKNNIINNSIISFELKSENSSYLISFFNEKYLINKINNTIVLTNLSNKKSQIIKNNDNFKIGNNDYILYNDATFIISAINKQIFDNNYGTSYNLYVPK